MITRYCFLSFFLLFSVVCFPEQNIKCAIKGCEVNNPEHGGWGPAYMAESCFMPGDPHPSSPWPIPGVLGYLPYHIKGRLKISVSPTSIGFASVPPPDDGERCITGYAETFTQLACDNYNAGCSSSGNCNTTYTASGTLCTMHYKDENTESYSYARFKEHKFRYFEWACFKPGQKPKPKPNLGPPSCDVQM